MNNLSIFIYLAEVVSNMGEAIVAIFFTLLLAYSTIFIMSGLSSDFGSSKDDYSKTGTIIYSIMEKYSKLVLIITISAIIFGSLIPNKQTIYLIAASEMGEEVYQSKEVQEIKNTLISIVKKYAEDEQL